MKSYHRIALTSLIAIAGVAATASVLSETLQQLLITDELPRPMRAVRNASMLLALRNPIAESSYMACVQNGVQQGMSPQKAVEACSTKLVEDADQGLGGDTIAGFGDAASSFNPGTITSACASGDPEQSRDAGTPHPPVQRVPWLAIDGDAFLRNPNGKPVIVDGAFVSEYGSFTFGGNPSDRTDKNGGTLDAGEDAYHYKGLTEEAAKKLKAELVEAAEVAKEVMNKALAESAADPGNKAKQEAAAKATTAFLKASEKASNDPNLVPVPATHDAGGDSTCELVLQSAREMLRECNRNGWKSGGCQILHAKMKGCDDPTKILIDPDAGYVCAPAVDPAMVAAAWQARCEQLTTPGPDGGTPCGPPDVSENGGFVFESHGDICSDPQAYVDAESGACIRTLSVSGFGHPDIQSIIQISLDKFGGPVVVLPSSGPAPSGPEPMPGPK